ncbi:MAG TPA: alpha/beta hydrolase [Terriglobia bacterium]|nr:alpha/beta hydrolase [Terriglobia bacterium]
MRSKFVLIPLLFLMLAVPGFAQLSPSAKWATEFATQYTVNANLTYRTASNQQLKMDVYYRRNVTTPQPTLVYMHGGFWVAGAKETAITALMPWLEMGWNVVNVEYRLGVAADPTTLAPAAVDDCFCALRFVAALPANYNIDKSRIVVTGESAGGHLALAMGMIPESAGIGRECTGAAAPPAAGGGRGAAAAPAAPPATPPVLPPVPKVAAVINWFGVTDVPDVIDGPNRQQAAARWFGDMPLPNALEIAKRVSPLTYVRTGLPPIITIHGDADRVVPYSEGVRLHEALAKINSPNQLVTIPGGGHGNFSAEDRVKIYVAIRDFLTKNGVMK